MKNKNSVFICQISENVLKVIRCRVHNSSRNFVGLESEVIPLGIDDKGLTEKITQALKKLEYSHHPLILSLPRNQITSRYIKIPAQSAQEIEKIVALQAPRYLPYPANELITGYQIISQDKDGYSNINLVITHKDAIEHCIGIFKELKAEKFDITLSSYGLVNLYHYINPSESETVMIVDIDFQQIEVVVISDKKLVFSRAFKFMRQPNWEGLFIAEINKTQDVYLRETAKEMPKKIIITGAGKTCQDFSQALKQSGLTNEVLTYEKIKISDDLLNKILTSDYSFANIIGLGLKGTEESMNLLPAEIKDETRKFSQQKEFLRLSAFAAGIILVLGLATAKNLDNKTLYLKQLKSELNKIAQEAKPLDEIKKRIDFIERRSYDKKISSLNVLYELSKNIPEQVSLINLSYEENNRVIIQGQAPELNYVLDFVGKLEKSTVFKNFHLKVRYATKKRIQTGEVIGFEIVGVKK